jgi:RNase P subunit RPR2
MDIYGATCEKCGSSNIILKPTGDMKLRIKKVLIKNVINQEHCLDCGHVQNIPVNRMLDHVQQLMSNMDPIITGSY